MIGGRVRRITRHMSADSAELFQSRLYGRYDSVQLVSFPRFALEGVYVWLVR